MTRSGRTLALALALAWSAGAHAAGNPSGQATFEFLDYDDPGARSPDGGVLPVAFNWYALVDTRSVEAWLPCCYFVPFPLDAFAGISSQDLWTSAAPACCQGTAMWAFANDTGRVRAMADTTFVFQAPPAPEPGHRFRTVLVWSKTFRKGSPGDTAHFTVNPSQLQVFGSKLPLGHPRDLPFAAIHIEVARQAWKGSLLQWRSALSSTVKLTPTPELEHGHVTCTAELFEPFPVWHCEWGHDAAGWTYLDSPLHGEVVSVGGDQNQGGATLETAAYRGTIELGDLAVGQQYIITYLLTAEAHGLGAEQVVRAMIGDPLDVSSGLSLDVTSLPAPQDAPPIPTCDLASDALRYADHRDGTVSDRLTGLMWQRCPLGAHLNDGATPDDPGDDRCVADSSGRVDWQGALQAALADGSAGHRDWRLPDVKELDSLVQLGCLAPAIDPLPFPDAPATPFWSATPARTPGASMVVSFLEGEVQALTRTGQAQVRLVRSGGDAVPLPPALTVERAVPVGEADPAPRELVFPVVLDRPAGAEVTFHYATADGTARAGEDYQAVSGTGTIPPGATRAEIRIPVLDDQLGEASETLSLQVDQVSSSARLLRGSAEGLILDDEPVLSVWPADVYEGQAGTTALVFWLGLDRPAASAVTVAYATSDGTARAGEDYLATSGTATIPASQRTASVAVTVLGDAVREADETVTLTLSGPSPTARLGRAAATGLIVDDEVPTLAALDDTGLTTCDTETQSGLACPQAGFPLQDAETGRDLDFPSDADGPRGFSLTKLDAAGVPLPDQSVPFGSGAWSCVRDEVTALWWEVKTDDGGPRDQDWTYTWYDSSGLDTGGSPGTPNGGRCADAVSCDTEKLVAAVNAVGLCGQRDWRLPGREELFSLHDSSSPNALSVAWFPHTPISNEAYWTATAIEPAPGPLPAPPARAWAVDVLAQGSLLPRSRSMPAAVRLVRGGR